MLMYQIKTVGLGNSVAEYTESYYKCDNCKGSGEINVSKEDLIDIIEGRSLKSMLKIVRAWKNNNHNIDCPECDGMCGEVVRS